jgi:hypothetical protein
MLRVLKITCLVLGLASLVAAQQPKAKSAARPTSKLTSPVAKAVVEQLKYDNSMLSENADALPPSYKGNDPKALYTAIKESKSLAPKSEFESTAAFAQRQSGFRDEALVGNLKPTGMIAFVVGNKDGIMNSVANPFSTQYDADAQVLNVLLRIKREQFILDPDRPTLEAVGLTSEILDRSEYIGTNAYGAQVKVTNLYTQDYGIAFHVPSWLSLEDDTTQISIPLDPNAARALKPNLRGLLLCRLQEPWTRKTTQGSKATIDDPFEYLAGLNYLSVSVEQLWVFDNSTGRVVRKFSEESATKDRQEQWAIRLKQYPLIVEIVGTGYTSIHISKDGEPEQLATISRTEKTTIQAKKDVTLRVSYEDPTRTLSFTVNGQPYVPKWEKEGNKIGNTFILKQATLHLVAPQ